MTTTTITLPLPDLELVFVQGGEFMMGDDNGEYDDEKPAHRVLVSGFWMSRFQVTQRLWQAVIGNNPSEFKGERRPVELVSWDDAQDFLRKLNALPEMQKFIRPLDPPGAAFRLPTEAEWEYAARGGMYSQDYKYAGSDRAKQVAWHDANSGGETHEVGLLLPNELGLYDMSGNVWEWCGDWFSGKYYAACQQQGLVENPQGPDRGEYRVLRGGSFFHYSQRCCAVYRLDNPREDRNDGIGFRLVLPLPAGS
ncbi:formylglycine-generating enzyme family protein [Candidatus Electronema sp. JC]|uniref:formylglycine-generating enzyme family protein n=1 Tax=Candidatus Electronema sp. JC TaxID=3401570 RepID=UPI003B439EC8